MSKIALELAKQYHKGQVRKFTGLPYYTHCEYVGNIASIYVDRRQKPTYKAVGYLHDTLEDTDLTVDDINVFFNKNVSRYVLELTNVDKSVGNKETRDRLNHERLVNASGLAQTVKTADILDNVPSMLLFDPNYGKKYLVTKMQLLNEFTRANEELLTIAKKTLLTLANQYGIKL